MRETKDQTILRLKRRVAELFYETLNEAEFKNKFANITFAILDREGESGKFAPFYEKFK